MFCHRSPYAVGADGERNLIGRRTQSNRVANAIRLDGERNPPLKINILTTDSVVSSLRTLNFCDFRAFRGRTIRTLNFCGFRAFCGHSFFPRNSQNSQNLLLWVFPIKKEATTKTAVASFYISTESEALLHANLLEQTLCVAPLIHEEEHVADIHTDAASQTLVEPDVA